MDSTNTPNFMWILCMFFVTMLLNIVAITTFGWITHTEVSLGFTPDISTYLQFEWWQQVYYIDENESVFPNLKEKLDCWCVPTENCGDVLKYWIYKPYTNQMISRSVVRPASEPAKTNKRAVPAPDVPINYKPGSDTDRKGRRKGE